jgi:predicted amidohydrolase
MTASTDDPTASLVVAAAQLSSQESVAENLRQAGEVVARAARAGARLVVLPENFAFMGSEEDKRRHAERLADPSAPIQSALREMARREGVTLVGGGFPERSADPERPYNTSLVLDARGEIAASYRKIHLFDVDLRGHGAISESAATLGGKDVVVTPIGGFQVGLSICYDVRFPELYRALVERGAEIITVPAAFTLYTGKDHWHVLLRARAIEAQCYVIAAAQWGKHPQGRATFGHALVVDPWGTVIAEASDRVGFALATIERAFLEEVRARVPSLRHRRL